MSRILQLELVPSELQNLHAKLRNLERVIARSTAGIITQSIKALLFNRAGNKANQQD